jgi:DNA invertase Pin-like site-specific DNA recombinase
MPAPLIGAAAAAAARLVAKKIAQRTTGGITGAGARSIQKIYKQTGPTKSQKDDIRREIGFEQDEAMRKIYKEHLKKMGK